jgi:uncharacterized LabA/DUF88 family protein
MHERRFTLIDQSEDRFMIFIDGENLSMRFGAHLAGASPADHITYKKDVFVWTKCLMNYYATILPKCLRTYYYTSMGQDDLEKGLLLKQMKDMGIESPRIFHRPKSGRSKQVDISLATEMLSHAYGNHFDFAVLVAGDADYIPLVNAVKSQGKRVYLWFIENGLSEELRNECDHFFNMKYILDISADQLARTSNR